MVVVAPMGLAGAEGEDTGHVAQVDLVLQPGAGLVGVDLEVLGQVDDRLDGELGVGVAAPVPDLGGGHRPRSLLEPGQAAGAQDGGVVEVDVQHHLTATA